MQLGTVSILVEKEKVLEHVMTTKVDAEQNDQPDALSIILQRLSILEEKIHRIEAQTKTHWVN